MSCLDLLRRVVWLHQVGSRACFQSKSRGRIQRAWFTHAGPDNRDATTLTPGASRSSSRRIAPILSIRFAFVPSICWSIRHHQPPVTITRLDSGDSWTLCSHALGLDYKHLVLHDRAELAVVVLAALDPAVRHARVQRQEAAAAQPAAVLVLPAARELVHERDEHRYYEHRAGEQQHLHFAQVASECVRAAEHLDHLAGLSVSVSVFWVVRLWWQIRY